MIRDRWRLKSLNSQKSFALHPCLSNQYTRELPSCDGFVASYLVIFENFSCGKDGSVMDWRHQSACRDEDPELFFPVGNTGPAITQIEEAKKVCNRCNVKEPCLAWALESGQDAGVWGGLSEDERRALKRRAARNRARLQEQNQINNPA